MVAAERGTPLQASLEDQRRKEAERRLRHSARYAELLGYLAGNGNVTNDETEQGKYRKKAPRVSIYALNTEVLTYYNTLACELFGTLSSPILTKKKDRQSGVYFYTTKFIANTIGDLRGHRWGETIRNRHKWILKGKNEALRKEYVWHFLKGFYDANGFTIISNNNMYLALSDVNDANMIIDCFKEVGVQTAKIRWIDKQRKKVGAVVITGSEDVFLTVQHIVPFDPEKRKRLSALVQIPEEVALYYDWGKAQDILQRYPHQDEYKNLFQNGQISHSHKPYIRNFGPTLKDVNQTMSTARTFENQYSARINGKPLTPREIVLLIRLAKSTQGGSPTIEGKIRRAAVVLKAGQTLHAQVLEEAVALYRKGEDNPQFAQMKYTLEATIGAVLSSTSEDELTERTQALAKTTKQLNTQFKQYKDPEAPVEINDVTVSISMLERAISVLSDALFQNPDYPQIVNSYLRDAGINLPVGDEFALDPDRVRKLIMYYARVLKNVHKECMTLEGRRIALSAFTVLVAIRYNGLNVSHIIDNYARRTG